MGAYLIYYGRDFPSCYINLPEVYEDVCDCEFSREKWQRAVKELDEFLRSLDRIERWIKDDFEWKCDDRPPVAAVVKRGLSIHLCKFYYSLSSNKITIWL